MLFPIDILQASCVSHPPQDRASRLFFTSGRSYQLLIQLFVLFYILLLHREVLHEIVPSSLQMIKIKNNLNRRRNKYPTLTYKED